MARLNLKRPSGSWGQMPVAVWNEISESINHDMDDGDNPYTLYFSLGVVDQNDSIIAPTQVALDSWHYNLGSIGLTAVSESQLHYDYCESAVSANSASGCFPFLPGGVTSHN